MRQSAGHEICERGNSINTHMRWWGPYSINTHTQSHTQLSAGPMQTTSSSPLPVANDRPTASWQENHLVAAKLLNQTKHCQPEQTVWSTMTTHTYTIVRIIHVIWLSWTWCVFIKLCFGLLCELFIILRAHVCMRTHIQYDKYEGLRIAVSVDYAPTFITHTFWIMLI